MNQYDEQLKEYEYLVIPTDNIIDMYQDELGIVRVVVGIGKKHQANGQMLIFLNGDSIVNGRLPQINYDLDSLTEKQRKKILKNFKAIGGIK